jgi:predicted transglutaminase-like protease
MRKIKLTLTTALAVSLSLITQVYSGEHHYVEEKVYIDESEMIAMDDAFYIHTGDNFWISTNSISKDKFGTFTYHNSILCTNNQTTVIEYQKTWKCPYCYRHYPVGKPCDNKDCPSKYR